MNDHYQKKEVDFLQKQRELQSLHRQLKNVLDEMDQSKKILDDFNREEEDEEEEEVFEILEKKEITEDQELRLLAHEIQEILHEVKAVKTALFKQQTPKNQDRIKLMDRQLNDLIHILEGQSYRVNELLQN